MVVLKQRKRVFINDVDFLRDEYFRLFLSERKTEVLIKFNGFLFVSDLNLNRFHSDLKWRSC